MSGMFSVRAWWSAGLCVFLCLAVGCDKEGTDNGSEAVSPTKSADQKAQPGQGEDSSDEHEHGEEEHAHGDEEHGHGGVHLADAMNELGRRFSAIWFAGEVGNAKMVHYQAHEIEEMVAELEAASPKENGVDVAERLQTDVVAKLERLEKLTKQGQKKDFDSAYETVMKDCESCHADTLHDYINLKKPDYNPYPNLDFTPQD